MLKITIKSDWTKVIKTCPHYDTKKINQDASDAAYRNRLVSVVKAHYPEAELHLAISRVEADLIIVECDKHGDPESIKTDVVALVEYSKATIKWVYE